MLHFKNAYACGNRTDLNISAESNYAEYLKFPTSSLRSDLASYLARATKVVVSYRGVADGMWCRLLRRYYFTLSTEEASSQRK